MIVHLAQSKGLMAAFICLCSLVWFVEGDGLQIAAGLDFEDGQQVAAELDFGFGEPPCSGSTERARLRTNLEAQPASFSSKYTALSHYVDYCEDCSFELKV